MSNNTKVDWPPILLRRRGMTQGLDGFLPSGSYLNIAYHHGGDYWFFEMQHPHPRQSKSHPECTISSWSRDFRRLPQSIKTLEAARTEVALQLQVTFDPQVEAYCYNSPSQMVAYPHLKEDVYLTCATYEFNTDTIRHEPSNVCLVIFRNVKTGEPIPHPHLKGEDGAAVYLEDRANEPYREVVARSVHWYNTNVTAHGTGRTRKEWLTWLIGQELRALPGQKVLRTKCLSRWRDDKTNEEGDIQ